MVSTSKGVMTGSRCRRAGRRRRGAVQHLVTGERRMSRIGRNPSESSRASRWPSRAAAFRSQGPKGKLSQTLPPGITARSRSRNCSFGASDDSKRQKALHGLTRSLLANAVTRGQQGLQQGAGDPRRGLRRRARQGQERRVQAGLHIPSYFPIPEGIEVKVERNVRLTVSGCSRQQVGQVAADIRSLRPPDVYKLKGIRYAGESLRKKAARPAPSSAPRRQSTKESTRCGPDRS